MPVPSESTKQPDHNTSQSQNNEESGVIQAKVDEQKVKFEENKAEPSSRALPSAPPNSAVGGKIRLVHSAPKSHSRSSIWKQEDEEQSQKSSSNGNDKNNNKTITTPSETSPKPVYSPVYFQITQSKEVLQNNSKEEGEKRLNGSSSRALELDTNVLNYKPGYSRHPSPKKVKFFETYYNKVKSTSTINKSEPDGKEELTSIKSNGSKSSEGPRKHLIMSHCEAVPLSDLKKRYGCLNKSMSKSAHVLNIAPRPVAAFPSKPLKAGSFVLARRKGKVDLPRSNSQVCLGVTTKTSPELNVYSFEKVKNHIEKIKKHFSDTTNSDTESLLPSLEDFNFKDTSGTDQLLKKSSELETPVPYNSCKTSVIGSDVLVPPESVLATRGTMRPWSGTIDGISDVRSDISSVTRRTEGGEHTSRSATSRRGARLKFEEAEDASPRASVSTNAFRPSKSVHMLNAGQAYANHNMKSKIGSNEVHKAFIMDIFKKSGLKPPSLSNSPYYKQHQQSERKYTGYSGFREDRKHKQRSKSLGRDEDNLRSKLTEEKTVKSAAMAPQTDRNTHLSILASRGGRDVLFKSRYSYGQSDYFLEKTGMKDVETVENKSIKTSDSKQASNAQKKGNKETNKASDQPTVTFADDVNKHSPNANNIQPRLQGTSSFKKINKKLATQMVGYSQANGDVMFDASHYEGFQHAKYSRRTNVDPRRKQDNTYTDDLKSKFLKVSVGGVGTGIPSETMDSPRSSEFTVSSSYYH